MIWLIDAEARDLIVRLLASRPEAASLVERLRHDTGAPVEDIARDLKRLDICAACAIEGQSASCESVHARAVGRRLHRLVEIARGKRRPWERVVEAIKRRL